MNLEKLIQNDGDNIEEVLIEKNQVLPSAGFGSIDAHMKLQDELREPLEKEITERSDKRVEELLLGLLTEENHGENKNSKKWVMEITEKTIGVKHPIDYDFEKIPVQTILMDDLVGFEPEDKKDKPESANKISEMAEMIKNGTYNLPPILVREFQGKYQVVDGHHRFFAHQSANSLTIEVRVIPSEDIIYKDSRPSK